MKLEQIMEANYFLVLLCIEHPIMLLESSFGIATVETLKTFSKDGNCSFSKGEFHVSYGQGWKKPIR